MCAVSNSKQTNGRPNDAIGLNCGEKALSLAPCYSIISNAFHALECKRTFAFANIHSSAEEALVPVLIDSCQQRGLGRWSGEERRGGARRGANAGERIGCRNLIDVEHVRSFGKQNTWPK